MANRTQIVCLCEGKEGNSIDPIFINRLMKSLKPSWIRPQGSNMVRIKPCNSRSDVIKRTPKELESCLNAGSDTTLMVWADCDDCADGDALKELFWKEAEKQEVSREDFDTIVFAFARYRLENWIQFLQDGSTDENNKGPRLPKNKQGPLAADAARKLAEKCQAGHGIPNIPPSLEWSCKNWRALVDRMK